MSVTELQQLTGMRLDQLTPVGFAEGNAQSESFSYKAGELQLSEAFDMRATPAPLPGMDV